MSDHNHIQELKKDEAQKNPKEVEAQREEDLKKFKSMDPEEVFEKTYITPKIVRILMEEDFRHIASKNRTMGFITIIEREFGLDLSLLRQKAEGYFEIFPDEKEIFDEELKLVKKRKRRSYKKLLFLLLLVAGGYFYYHNYYAQQQQIQPQQQELNVSQKIATQEEVKESSLQSSSTQMTSSTQMSATSMKRDEKKQESVSAASLLQEENESTQMAKESVIPSQAEQEENTTLLPIQKVDDRNNSQEENRALEQPVAAMPTLKIIPKEKLWVGIIYLDNYKHENHIISSPLELNTSRDQLIVTGHGMMQIKSDGEIQDFNEIAKQRFIYRNGKLEKIDRKTFRLYNRGRDW